MSRRIRINVIRWWCHRVGHRPSPRTVPFTLCTRCHSIITWSSLDGSC